MAKAKGGISGFAVGRKDVFTVPVDVLKEEPNFNCRLEYNGIEEFAQYVFKNGVMGLPPMKVYAKHGDPDGLYISEGHRRIRAVRRAIEMGAEIKGVLVMNDPGNEEDRTFNLISSNQGNPLTKIEQGLVFMRLVGYGWNQAQISERVGMSPAFISQAITLARAPKKIQDLITQGAVKDSTVLDAVTGADDEAQAYEVLVKSIEDSNNNGEGNRGVSRRVKAAVGKVSASGRIKLLNEMIEEQSLVLKDSPKYQAVKEVYAFLNGEKTVDELIAALK